MKIWITRSSAFSIQVGGLERLSVWFSEPRFVNQWRTEDDYPFYNLSDLSGRLAFGWEHGLDDRIRTWISAGRFFGYNDRKNKFDNEIASKIWEALCEHFHNEPFLEWDKIEKEGRAHPKDFLLEIEIDMHITQFNKLKGQM